MVLSVRDRAVVDILCAAQTRIDAGDARMGYSAQGRCNAHVCRHARIAPVLGLFLARFGPVTGARAHEIQHSSSAFSGRRLLWQMSSAFSVGAYFGAL